MKLIWQMWCAVRLFRDHLTEDAFYDFLNTNTDFHWTEEQKILHLESDFFHQRTAPREPARAHRQNLWVHLLDKYGDRDEKHLAEKVRHPHGTIPLYGFANAKKSDFINDLINACVTNGFIAEDKRDRDRFFITEKGMRFKSIDGLLIEWAKYLKPLGIAGIFGGLWALRELIPHFINLYNIGKW